MLTLALFVLVDYQGRHGNGGYDWFRIGSDGHAVRRLLDRDTHMTAVATFAAIPFVLTDAAFDSNTCILATSTGTLSVTPLLALAATLAPWFR
jgi:hypothetical protein